MLYVLHNVLFPCYTTDYKVSLINYSIFTNVTFKKFKDVVWSHSLKNLYSF